MTFADLTWNDLEEWAGERVVARGKSYRRAVEDLRVTTDGRLLAWVQGGDRYATLVSIDTPGGLSSICTCPYGVACKHAVAMVLSYLEAIQARKSVAGAEQKDERFDLLEQALAEDEIDQDEDDSLPEVAAQPRRRSKKSETTASHYLESLTHSALLDLVRQLAGEFPQVRQRLADRAELQSGDLAKLVANTRREIARASAEPGWTGHWSNERSLPDYSRVRERLEMLLKSGHADEVVTLGQEVLQRGIQQIEMSDDEGETGQEITSCMAVVFRALRSCSKRPADRLLWEIDAHLRDEYGILENLEGPLAETSAVTAADWSVVADELRRRLEAITIDKTQRAGEWSDGRYRRQTIMRWLLDALQQGGRARETTAILLREAELTNCYVELVDHLLADKQEDAAVEWARKGFERTIEKLPGIAWALEERLRDLAARQTNPPLVAAFRALEFFDHPEVERYTALQQAATFLGLWEQIRPMLLRWLETGARPDARPKAKAHDQKRPREKLPEQWPLPPTGLPLRPESRQVQSFPDTEALIAIAILEKRHDDVLHWYKQRHRPGGWGADYQGESVAEAVQETHPAEALNIWKRQALSHIAMTNRSAYQIAGGYLKKMKTVYQRTDRLAEWAKLLTELRAANARKPRLIEVLDALENSRLRILKA